MNYLLAFIFSNTRFIPSKGFGIVAPCHLCCKCNMELIYESTDIKIWFRVVWLDVLNNLESDTKYSKSRNIFLAAAFGAFCRMCQQSRPLDSLLHAAQSDYLCADWVYFYAQRQLNSFHNFVVQGDITPPHSHHFCVTKTLSPDVYCPTKRRDIKPQSDVFSIALYLTV